MLRSPVEEATVEEIEITPDVPLFVPL